jgi:hypothetical protein
MSAKYVTLPPSLSLSSSSTTYTLIIVVFCIHVQWHISSTFLSQCLINTICNNEFKLLALQHHHQPCHCCPHCHLVSSNWLWSGSPVCQMTSFSAWDEWKEDGSDVQGSAPSPEAGKAEIWWWLWNGLGSAWWLGKPELSPKAWAYSRCAFMLVSITFH